MCSSDLDGCIDEAKTEVAKAYAEYSSVKRRLKSLFGNDGDRERRIDVLKFQIDEINKANVTAGEEQDLILQRKRLNAAEKIMAVLNDCYDSLYQSEPSNVLSAVKSISNQLQSIGDVDTIFEKIGVKVDETYYALEEIAESVRNERSEERRVGKECRL